MNPQRKLIVSQFTAALNTGTNKLLRKVYKRMIGTQKLIKIVLLINDIGRHWVLVPNLEFQTVKNKVSIYIKDKIFCCDEGSWTLVNRFGSM